MIHYTPLEPLDIWTDPSDFNWEIEERTLEGVRVLLRKGEGMTWSVVQVISTDPEDYLRPELQPGTQVGFAPIINRN
jgi:hypothetical protein